MKILLVGNYLPDRQESMQRFAEMMEQELSHAGHEVRLIRPVVKLGKFSWPNKLQKWIGHIDKFLLFPSALRRATAWADVVHICDHSNAMYVKHVASRPHLVTCHDLLAVRGARGEFPVDPVGFTGKLLQKWIARGLKSAKFIVCVSNATRLDCMRVLDIDASRLEVVYSGLNYPYYPMPIGEAEGRLDRLGMSNKRRFLMHVGSNTWYKNRLGVLKIFAQLVRQHQRDIDLIFAGRKLTAAMNKFIAEAGIEKRVKQLGAVSNEDLCALYSRAEGLIFPSLEEGFGWPVLEAQASGCPVFTSNRAPMTEIGGDAAVYIYPLLPEQSADVIDQHLDALQGMRERGVANGKKFSNAAMRDAYLEIYSRIAHTL